MNFKTIKSAADLPIKHVEIVKTDSAITEVIIAGCVHVRGDYGPLKIMVAQPYETADRYRMTATTPGFDPKVTYHDNQWDADSAAKAFDGDVTTVVERLSVLIDGAGVVVGPADAASRAAPELAEIPF